MLVSELVQEHSKLGNQLVCLPEQLVLFLTVLPEFTVTKPEKGKCKSVWAKLKLHTDLERGC